MTARALRVRAIVGFVACAVAIAGCSKRSMPDEGEPVGAPAGSCACPGSAPIVNPELLAFLSKARAAHHEADLAEESGDKAGAVRALERLADGPHPGGTHPPPEVAEVQSDTRARLAELESSIGHFEAAERHVEVGLKLATATTHFRGHLFEVKGLVLERLSKSLDAAGDRPGAARAKQQAVDAYEKAIAIQDDVIKKALPADAPR